MADQTPISSASYSSMADTQNYDFANLVFINVATQATIRLTPDNFFTWKAQWDALLYGYALTGYVDGSLPCPSPSSNLASLFWTRQDQLLFGSLLASLSPDLASMVVSAKTSRELWRKLCLIYAKPSRSRIIRLRENEANIHNSDIHTPDDIISISDIHTPDDIISIDHQLYKAAAIGQISAFEQHRDRLQLLLTRDSESGKVSKQTLLRMKNKAGDTALHESMALKLNKYTDQPIRLVFNNFTDWFKHREVAMILSEEDIEVMHDRNAAGETPLYLAVKAGFYSVVKKGLHEMDAQRTSTYYGGSDGRTILHEAVISNFYEIGVILEKRKELCRVADDEKGWVPLHYAANLGRKYALERLLECDPFAACIKDKNGQIPLQVIADPKICRWFIEKIISSSPDCCELLTIDEKFYHDDYTAVAATWFVKATKYDLITKWFLQIIKWFLKSFRRDFTEFEEETEHAFMIWTETFNDGKKPDEELLDKESTLVVAALIATVTFAAGFTLPGGYVSGGDNLPSNGGSQPGFAGSAVLSENAAFKAFLVSDAIAMVLSSCAVFIHLFLALKKDRTKDRSYFFIAFNLIIIAMVLMVVAFMTGIYAVLGSSNSFAIASCFSISAYFLLWISNICSAYCPHPVYLSARFYQRLLLSS
nr:ankyrin repeat-containing protein ITN1-like isoform X2 [Ziziphus jujuba var. spinosa]